MQTTHIDTDTQAQEEADEAKDSLTLSVAVVVPCCCCIAVGMQYCALTTQRSDNGLPSASEMCARAKRRSLAGWPLGSRVGAQNALWQRARVRVHFANTFARVMGAPLRSACVCDYV